MFKMVFFGVFLFFALIFALCGMLKGRKYKWQFSATRIILLVIATLITTVISALIGWFAGGVLANTVLPMLESAGGKVNVGELLKAVPSAPAIIRAIVAMIVAPVVFLMVFAIVKPLIKLLTSPICKLLLKIGKKKPVEEAAPAENLETLDETAPESAEAVEATEEGAPSIADGIPSVEGIEGVQMVKTTVITHTIDERIETTKTSSQRKKAKKYDKFRSDKKFDPLGAVLGAACSVLTLVVLLVPFVGDNSDVRGAVL